MMTVLHNVFIDEQRRKRVEARHADTLVQMSEEMAPPAQEAQVRLAQIRRAFLTLPEEQRAALHLVTLEGMAYADAAAVLGIPIGTLMSRLGRGRAALRAFEEGERQGGGVAGRRQRLATERPRLRLVAQDADDASLRTGRAVGDT
jgi:RNA polymerase sigma-70 factor (ECF subfamily)